MDIWQLVAINGTALVAVIGVLWRVVNSVWYERKETIDKLEQKNEETQGQIVEIKTEFAKLVGEREGEKFALERMLETVVREVRKDKEANDVS